MISASVLGTSSAAATPCSARAPISSRGVRARPRSQRRDSEAGDAEREDPAAAEHVAERAADEQQRAERQQVGVDHPLLGRETAVQARPDRRQRDVDDRSVEERRRGPEDACEQRQPLGAVIRDRRRQRALLPGGHSSEATLQRIVTPNGRI